MDMDERRQFEDQSVWSYRKFVIVMASVVIGVALIVWLLLSIYIDPIILYGEDEDAETFDPATFWLILSAVYLGASYRFWDQIDIDRRASLTLFGMPLTNVGAGAPFAPPFIITIERVPANVLQREFPAEPENIDRTELKGGYEIAEGKRPPLRIQFRDSIDDERARKLFGQPFNWRELQAEGKPKNEINRLYQEYTGDYTVQDLDGNYVDFIADAPIDGLARRVTAEVQHVVRIVIDNPSLFKRNIGDTTDAFSQIEDEMVSVLTRYFTRMSVGQGLANMRWMSLHLHRAVERRVGARGDVKSWGVDVQMAFVKLIHTDHGLNIAISEAAQAPFEKEQVVITAEGERAKRILEGEGAAKASRELEKQTLQGRALGIKDIARQLGVEPDDALAAEVARALGEGGNAIIVGPQGITDIAAIATAFNQNRGGTPSQ